MNLKAIQRKHDDYPMKDKSHRQRIEDELFYSYDPRFEKKCMRDITICVVVALVSFASIACGLVVVVNWFRS